ncbi:hypothetical protein ACOACO_07975 [Nocardioides sp. CPCC 205120]|uniref:hypothetical protein n=1 Tax=Nocardioides sp. CPCC 205120 TaxID=3406462 RepID=UPI003B514BE9
MDARRYAVVAGTGTVLVVAGSLDGSLGWFLPAVAEAVVLLAGVPLAGAVRLPVAMAGTWLAVVGLLVVLLGGGGDVGYAGALALGALWGSLFLLLWAVAAGVVLHSTGPQRLPTDPVPGPGRVTSRTSGPDRVR